MIRHFFITVFLLSAAGLLAQPAWAQATDPGEQCDYRGADQGTHQDDNQGKEQSKDDANTNDDDAQRGQGRDCDNGANDSTRYNFSSSDLFLRWSTQGSTTTNCAPLYQYDPNLGSLHVCGIWWDESEIAISFDWHSSPQGHGLEAFSGIYESELGYLYTMWSMLPFYTWSGTNSASGGLPD